MPATALQLKFRTMNQPLAKPFVKWVGGKRKVISEIIHDMPCVFKHYYEPFVGGGALFFHLRSSGVLLDHDITLSDINLRLIRTYRAVRDDVENLIDRLEGYSLKHSSSFFYQFTIGRLVF